MLYQLSYARALIKICIYSNHHLSVRDGLILNEKTTPNKKEAIPAWLCCKNVAGIGPKGRRRLRASDTDRNWHPHSSYFV